jgi:CDP-diacylglycerol--glycerol-3-phosphate 3-phosphatidyltransferase
MRSSFGRFLVAGRFMRILYAAVKAGAFSGLALLVPFPAVLPWLWAQIGWLIHGLTYFFVYLSVVLCIVRGLPVIAEFVYSQRQDILGHRRTK